jgi:very-short-patch-repair endonuclease
VIDDCVEYAKSKHGKCLSTEYTNSIALMCWECDKGHQWNASFSNVKNNNSWCPKCTIGKTQKQLHTILDNLLNIKTEPNFRGFEWQKTERGGKQEFDYYSREHRLASEYDGKQHYCPIEYFGGQEHLEHQQQLDALKNTKVAQHPEDVAYFIRFNYQEPITSDYVLHKLIAADVPIFYLINGMNTWH